MRIPSLLPTPISQSSSSVLFLLLQRRLHIERKRQDRRYTRELIQFCFQLPRQSVRQTSGVEGRKEGSGKRGEEMGGKERRRTFARLMHTTKYRNFSTFVPYSFDHLDVFLSRFRIARSIFPINHPSIPSVEG